MVKSLNPSDGGAHPKNFSHASKLIKIRFFTKSRPLLYYPFDIFKFDQLLEAP